MQVEKRLHQVHVTPAAKIVLVTYPTGTVLHRTTCPDGQFWLTLGGSWNLRSEHERSQAGVGQIQYYAPHTPAHREVTSPTLALGVQLFSRHFDGISLDSLAKYPERARSALRTILKLVVRPNPEFAIQAEEALLPLFDQQSPQTEYRRVADLATQILEAEFRQEISLGEIARRLDITPTYLATVFTRMHGLTFSQFRRRLRLKAAVGDLVGSNRHRGEIAVEAGFYDASHFHHAFEAEFGVPPSSLSIR